MQEQVFDARAYIGPWPYSEYGIRDPERLIAEMHREGISAAAVSSTFGVLGAIDRANHQIRNAAKRFPKRIRPVYVTAPRHHSAKLETLRDWTSEGCIGISLWPQHHSYSLSDLSVQRLLESVEAAGLILFLMGRATANWGLPHLSPDDVRTVAAIHKNLQIVFGGFNYDDFVRAVDLAAENSNVHLEISCLQMREPLKALLQYLDPARILLGTGVPLQYARCSLEKVRGAQIAETQKRAIAFDNASKLLRLG